MKMLGLSVAFFIFFILSIFVPQTLLGDIYIHQENTFYDYSPYLYFKQQSQILDNSAGISAISSIDFSNNSEGKFSIGFGLGGGVVEDRYSSAFAFAFRYGITDEDAFVTKGFIGANGTSSVGFGWSHDF